MGTATLHLDHWSLAWRQFCQKLAPQCADRSCLHTQTLWRRICKKRTGVIVQGLRYCQDECLERALISALRRARGTTTPTTVPHRIPLGLLLLSRQQITVEQLRAGLIEQRAAGRGRIGEWLQTLGFVTEHEVTAALARQWCCPILRRHTMNLTSQKSVGYRSPQIPATLLESFVMIPVDYVEATATLHLAFAEGVDYTVLYAIEQMVGCHTEFCMAAPSFVRRELQALAGHRLETEVVFELLADSAEVARIIRSYCLQLSASEIRLTACGPHLWVRLLCPARPPLDLLLRSPRNSPSHLPLSVLSPALCAV